MWSGKMCGPVVSNLRRGRAVLPDMIGSRELSWDGCINVRDLGGLGRMRLGAVVRMEAPTRLSVEGWAAAWAYGVRTIVDLRHEDECRPDLVPRPTGITGVRVPLSLVLLTLAGARPEEIIADYLLAFDRMKPRYDELGVRDQLAAITETLASHDTTLEASLTSTITSLAMPDFLLENGLRQEELTALRARLAT